MQNKFWWRLTYIIRKEKKSKRKEKEENKKNGDSLTIIVGLLNIFFYTRALNSLEKKLRDGALSNTLQKSIDCFCKGTDK